MSDVQLTMRRGFLAWDQMRSDYAANLTEAQRFAAYAAGQNDAAASPVQEKLAVSSAKTAGTNSSLVYDDFVRKAVERSRNDSGPAYLTQETVEQVNSVAKDLGLRVRSVDQVDGGRANAEITGNEVQIEPPLGVVPDGPRGHLPALGVGSRKVPGLPGGGDPGRNAPDLNLAIPGEKFQPYIRVGSG